MAEDNRYKSLAETIDTPRGERTYLEQRCVDRTVRFEDTQSTAGSIGRAVVDGVRGLLRGENPIEAARNGAGRRLRDVFNRCFRGPGS